MVHGSRGRDPQQLPRHATSWEIRHEPLTPALICDLHRVVTAGTLEDPGMEGRVQLPGEERVRVEDLHGTVLHIPPSAEQLPDRLQQPCDFANAAADTAYIPPVVRAIAGALHAQL